MHKVQGRGENIREAKREYEKRLAADIKINQKGVLSAYK